jgi:hypothetical protein
MRRPLFIFFGALLAYACPAAAGPEKTKAAIQGFGGITFGSSSIVGTSASSTFGGRVTAGLTPNIDAIGEAGRMSDIKPPLLDLLDFASVDLQVRAWYAEGGVRLIASPQTAVRPYAEATAGFAKLSTSVSGLDGRLGTAIDEGLEYLNRTEPLLGAGGGIVVEGGPINVDVGYRYKKILASGVASALNGGSAYQVNEVRVGLGFRF